MTEQDVESLDPELRAFVDAERRRPAAPADARERLLHRLVVDIGGGGGDFGPSGDGGPAGPEGVTSSPPPGGTLGAARAVAQRPLVVAAVSFVVGVTTGVGLHAGLSRSSRQERPVATVHDEPRPGEAPEVKAAVPEETPPSQAGAAAPALPPAPRKPKTERRPEMARAKPDPADLRATEASPPRGHDTDLASERALVEVARTAMSRGDHSAALETLQRHATLHPDGRLAEEREALMVQALVSASRADEARGHARQFHKHFPNSLLLPVVDAALRSIP